MQGIARSNCHILKLLLGALANFPTASMPAAARSRCIVAAKILEQKQSFFFRGVPWRSHPGRMLFKIVPRAQVRELSVCLEGGLTIAAAPAAAVPWPGRRLSAAGVPAPTHSPKAAPGWLESVGVCLRPRSSRHCLPQGSCTLPARVVPWWQETCRLPPVSCPTLSCPGWTTGRSACSAAEEGSEGARERGRERARTAAAPADIPVSARWRERKRFIVHLGLTTSSDCPALVSCFGARTCADALHQLAIDRQLLRGRVRRLRRREPVW